MVIPLRAHRSALAGPPSLGAPVFWSVLDDGAATPADERRAFEVRMRAAWPAVVRMVERLLAWPGSKSEVEDVAQEAFLAAWRARHTFRAESEWTTWIHSIALRRARNAARSRERRQRWFGRSNAAPDLDALSIDGSEPSESSANAVSSSVRTVLQRLRHADREVLVLRYLEGLAVEEIAARLELGRAAVDARLTRARTRMRSSLEELEDPEATR